MKRIPNHKFLGARKAAAEYEWMTFREAATIVDELTEGLLSARQNGI